MPNWCTNHLSITGPESELQRFQKQARSDEAGTLLTFNAFVPMPPGLENGAYCDWACANWGTKWDLDESVKEESTCTRLLYIFDTAWSPPGEWLAAVAQKLYPKLNFELEYCEEGNCFAGRSIYEEGAFTCDATDISCIEMQLNWYDEVTVMCDYCGEDMTITSEKEERVCEDCFTNLCVHCKKMRDAHVKESKCPFAATQFLSREMQE